MIPKPFDEIARGDIEALRDNQVPEGRQIDYKESLPGNTDEDKREFLADASSFANAAGGDLLFGVSEDGGVPVEIRGLAGVDVDAETLRLENVMRDGIAPRMPGVRIRAVGGFPDGPVLVIRFPRSWAAPHMVTFKNLSRFYTRNNAGKYQLDVSEIRVSFALSEALPERIRRFRDDRLARVIADETPVRLLPNPKTILHLVPYQAFAVEERFSAQDVASVQASLQPIWGDGIGRRYNLDGFIRYTARGDSPVVCDSYCQMFRSGIIEAVDSHILREDDGRRMIQSVFYEQKLVQATNNFLAAFRQLDVQPPVLLLLNLVGVTGYDMAVAPGLIMRFERTPIDRDLLLLPEVLIENLDYDVPQALRPVFDALWNAAGLPRSLNYDEGGNWRIARHA